MTLTFRSPRWWPLLAAVMLLPLHLGLKRSQPGKDARVTRAPADVKLWFTQDVSLGVTRITVTDAAKRIVGTRGLSQTEDGAVVAAFGAPLADGAYTVSWRTMAKDGHVVKGDFQFTVAATPGS